MSDKLSERFRPQVCMVYGSKRYSCSVQAAKVLSKIIAQRLAWRIQARRVKEGLDPIPYRELHNRQKVIAKRAYPRCKYYVGGWLR